MILQTLRTYNFRNLCNGVLDFGQGLNLIRGKNGQGKTNLVEAIYVLAFGKGFRSSENTELQQWGTNESSVFGSLQERRDKTLEPFELGISIRGKKKEFYRDGAKISRASDYLGVLCCVCFTPNDLLTLKGAPALRRKFIDRHAMFAMPGYVERLLDVQRALAHKQALLRQGVREYEQYFPWNQIIVQQGRKVSEQRRDFVVSLEGRARAHLSRLAPQEEELSLSLNSSLLESSEEELLSKAERYLERELRLKSPALGPQRDELETKLGSVAVREYASQGQTRSAMVALKLALIDSLFAARGEEPVVVLDDVESELDRSRVQALFELISSRSQQIFVTGTDCAWVADRLQRNDSERRSFEVHAGRVTLVEDAAFFS